MKDYLENSEKQQGYKRLLLAIMLIYITSTTMLSILGIILPKLMIDFQIESTAVSLVTMTALLTLGVAAVVYSTLSDSVSIKKLMLIGLCLYNLGAVLAFVSASINYYMFLAAIGLMVFGGTCGQGLLIITVTRYMDEAEHTKYYGYNTACFSISQASGILLGGFFATYIGWKYVFFLPLLSILAIPVVLKYAPDDAQAGKGSLDVIGLTLLALFTVIISLFFNFNNLLLLFVALILIVLFIFYIAKSEKAFIDIKFFKNRNFVIVIGLATITLGLQAAFAFIFPFMAQAIYSITLDKVSAILFPGYLTAAFVGANSGKIVEKIGSSRALTVALCFVVMDLIFGALWVDKGIIVIGIVAALFSGGYALIYSLFIKEVLATLRPDQIGAGVGFFNLLTSIGPSLLTVLTGKMLASSAMHYSFGFVEAHGSVFSNIWLVFASCLVFVVLVLSYKKKILDKKVLTN